MNTHEKCACLFIRASMSCIIHKRSYVAVVFKPVNNWYKQINCCMLNAVIYYLKKDLLSEHLEIIIRQLYLISNDWRDICLLIYWMDPDKQVRHLLPAFC